MYKGEIMFGKIVGQKVLLLNHVYKFTEVEDTLITRLLKPKRDTADIDIFLRQSTKAWWLACDKMRNDLNLNAVLKKI